MKEHIFYDNKNNQIEVIHIRSDVPQDFIDAIVGIFLDLSYVGEL